SALVMLRLDRAAPAVRQRDSLTKIIERVPITGPLRGFRIDRVRERDDELPAVDVAAHGHLAPRGKRFDAMIDRVLEERLNRQARQPGSGRDAGDVPVELQAVAEAECLDAGVHPREL